ncbi:MAG: hydrolase, partial [Candidatus Aminicenantes bacterium]
MKAAVVLLVGILLSTVTVTAAGATPAELGERATQRVPRVDSPVGVDAVLDEDVWDQALRLELPYEQRPGDSTPAEVETEVLLAYGESHVYAAFIAHDPDPSQICAHLSDRDKIWSDDWVLLVLDTFNSERQAYNFACNPLGVQGDTYESPHGEDESWDATWDSAGRLTGDGYIVEMAIPFSSLRFQRTEGEQVWGFDVARSYPRSVSYRFGIFEVDRDSNCYACQYPKLIGFAGASPGRNLEFDPTVSAVTTQERKDWPEGDFSELDSSQDFGLTARWGVTPNLTLSGTANPDFSQVEADAWQLDVNKQFALFYDEKRPFFTEGAEIFRDRLSGVYTRTLADPSWGLKLTGKEGD